MASAAKTWSGEWWRLGGGGPVWDAISYDPALNLLYFGIGNGIQWARSARSAGKGDNLFLASIIALNADTGSTPGTTRPRRARNGISMPFSSWSLPI